MRGCDFRPFGMDPFEHFGAPGFGGFGCARDCFGPTRHFGRPGFGPFGRHHGRGFFRPGPPCCHERGPREDMENSCRDFCGIRGPGRRGPSPPHDGPRHVGPNGPGAAECEHRTSFEPRHHHGPEGRHGACNESPCGPHHHKERSPHGRNSRPCHGPHEEGRPHGPPHHGPFHQKAGPKRRPHGHGPCHGPHHGPGPHEGRPHKRCHGPHHEKGHGHHEPHFGHFGAHRRPFGPWNRRCPYERPSDEESGNETEPARKNGPRAPKNNDQSPDATILVQRIVVEKAPRCYSV